MYYLKPQVEITMFSADDIVTKSADYERDANNNIIGVLFDDKDLGW